MAQKLATPLQNIALSLSGGGYRAAAFHLGSMSFLHHAQWKGAPLLRQLAVLSTISGGTITGVKYALCLAQGKAFEVFFKELYLFLKQDTLVPTALATLNNHDLWGKIPKQQNLINAFAQVYHDQLLDGNSLGLLLDVADEHFPEVVFNSTDLENQLPFRFQKSDGGIIGHGNAGIPAAIAREIRLSDIVAASSCFPGGFEPLVMPRDFVAAADSPLAAFWKDKMPLRLMDGGVVDNQGIESVMLFEKRKSKNSDLPFVGTFLVSDVSRKNVNIPKETKEGNPLLLQYSIKQINQMAMLVTAVAIALLWFAKIKALIMLASILLTLSSIWLVLGFWVARKFVAAIKNTVSQESPSFIEDFDILRSVKLKYVFKQLESRLTSLGRLGDVFLSRIRDLNYRMLYSDKGWKYRLKTNYIYHLKEQTDLSEPLRAIVQKANEMGTTLWFSDENPNSQISALDALVITGQATLCQNMIRYIEDLKKEVYLELPQEVQAELNQFQSACKRDFERFGDEPGWLMKLYQPEKIA